MDYHERTILIESGVRRGGGLFPAEDSHPPCLTECRATRQRNKLVRTVTTVHGDGALEPDTVRSARCYPSLALGFAREAHGGA